MTQIQECLLAPRLSRSQEAHFKGAGWHYTPVRRPRRTTASTCRRQRVQNRRFRRRTAEVGLAVNGRTVYAGGDFSSLGGAGRSDPTPLGAPPRPPPPSRPTR